jgi:hypothetical protein
MIRARKESKSALAGYVFPGRTVYGRTRLMPPSLARLGIDDFFALERGLRHCWPSKR